MLCISLSLSLCLFSQPRARADNTVAWCNDPANGEDLVLCHGSRQPSVHAIYM